MTTKLENYPVKFCFRVSVNIVKLESFKPNINVSWKNSIKIEISTKTIAMLIRIKRTSDKKGRYGKK